MQILRRKPRENKLERWFVDDECAERGLLTTKVNKKGWPDRVVVGYSYHVERGHTAWLELKREGEDLDPMQERVRNEFQRRGQTVHVCRTRAECVHALDREFGVDH